MGVRRVIPKEAQKAEGDFLKQAIKAAGRTQASMPEIYPEVSDKLLGLWCQGRTRIPDLDMLRLGRLLQFNAFEVRPSLMDYADFFDLGSVLASLPDEASHQIRWIMEVSKKGRDKHFTVDIPPPKPTTAPKQKRRA